MKICNTNMTEETNQEIKAECKPDTESDTNNYINLDSITEQTSESINDPIDGQTSGPHTKPKIKSQNVRLDGWRPITKQNLKLEDWRPNTMPTIKLDGGRIDQPIDAPKAEPINKPKAEPINEPKAEPINEPINEPKKLIQQTAKPKTKRKNKQEPKLQVDTGINDNPELNTGVKPESKIKRKMNLVTKVDTNTDTNTEINPETNQEIKPDVKPAIEPKIKIRRKMEPKIKPEIKPFVKPNTDPNVNPGVNPIVDPGVNPCVNQGAKPDKLYTIYSIPNYDIAYGHFRKHGGKQYTLVDLEHELTTNDKGYHMCVSKMGTYIVFGDLDYYQGDLIFFFNLLLEELRRHTDIPLNLGDISYTRNMGKPGSYHYSLKKLHCSCEMLKRMLTRIYDSNRSIFTHIGTDGKGRRCIDTGIYADHLFRYPYQRKAQEDPEAYHKVIRGELRDFIVEYIPEGSTLLEDKTVYELLVDALPVKKNGVQKNGVQKAVPVINPEVNLPELSEDELSIARVLLVKSGNTLDENLALLNYLFALTTDADWDDHDTWIDFGMIICNVTGKSVRGFQLWDKLSRRSKKYKSSVCHYRWGKFTIKKMGILRLMSRMRIENSKMYNQLTRLSYKHTDELLLRNSALDVNIHEECKYIGKTKEILSNIVVGERLFIVLHNPTGNGKTKTTEDIASHCLTLGYSGILSVITRRAMSSTHMTSLSVLGLTSYLDAKNDKKNYICSLEQIVSVHNVNYDILILDELTSILMHFYSSTMGKQSMRSLIALEKLITNAKVIISGDAIITDMALNFVRTFGTHKKLYYRNTFKNKTGSVLCINQLDRKITNDGMFDIICGNIIAAYDVNKSVMVMSDSKKIAEKIYVRLRDLQGTNNNLLLYTSIDGGDDLGKCNELWLNKIVIFSPKIIYGLDCTIKYDSIFAIYMGDTINSFHMIQQISRARNVKRVEVFFMRMKYLELTNTFVKFEDNCKQQDELMKDFTKNNNLNLPDKVLSNFEKLIQLQSASDNKFKDVHNNKTWYDNLFNRNRGQLLISLCEEQGYTIEYKTIVVPEGPQVAISTAGYTAEYNQHRCIYYDIMFDSCCGVKNESPAATSVYMDINNRRKLFKDDMYTMSKCVGMSIDEIAHDPIMRKIFTELGLFDKCYNSQFMMMTSEKYEEYKKGKLKSNISFVEMTDTKLLRIDLIRWIESKIRETDPLFGRYYFDDLKDGPWVVEMINLLLKDHSHLLPGLYKDADQKRNNRSKKMASEKLKKIKDLNGLLCVLVKLHNKIIPGILKCTKSQIFVDKEKKRRRTVYENIVVDPAVRDLHKHFYDKRTLVVEK